MNPKEFLEDNNGGFSAMRLSLLIWILGVLVVWVRVSWHNGVLQAIPDPIVAILGILVGGKSVQRFGEKSDGQAPLS